MKTSLLLVPTKKTDDVNWQKFLNSYLLSIYGNTVEFQGDLSQFHKLRQDLRGANADATGIQMYFKYYSQLELVDLRIPIAQANKHKKLTFTWYDAFLPAAQHQQYSLPFEKAGVLFNLASLMLKAASLKYNESQKSAQPGLTPADDTSFKDAIQYFQQAAGIFDFIGQSFLHAPSNDLNPATIKFLKNLCLAQSQEMFNLKVIDGDLEQKKNSLISKLCMSTSTHYQQCFAACSRFLNADSADSSLDEQSTFAVVEAGINDEDDLEVPDDAGLDEYNPDSAGIPQDSVTARIDLFWVAVIQIKSIYYRSLSYYFHGLNLEATRKYGEAIANLSKSLEIINEVPSQSFKKVSKVSSHDRLSGNAYDLLDNLKYHKDALEIKLKELNKDNDLIYNEIVPSLVTLPEPKPMDSSKVIPMNQIELFSKINEWNYENFLKNVVPLNIYELLSYYSEEKSQFLRNEIDEIDVSNEELSSVLEFLKLPLALAHIKELLSAGQSSGSLRTSLQSLDASTIKKVQDIYHKYEQDMSNREKIDELRQSILENIEASEKGLAQKITPNTGNYREDLIKVKKALYEAAVSDAKLFALVDDENVRFYETLSKGTGSREFEQLFEVPSKTVNSGGNEEVSLLDIDELQLAETSVEGQIGNLEDILRDLNNLRTGKSKLLAKLKEEIHNDDISDILMLNSKIKLTNEIKTVIFPEELKKFDVYSRELDIVIKKQQELINELKARWKKLVSNPRVEEVQSLLAFRNEVFQQQTERINKFYDNSWKRYSSGLSKGVVFYSQLEKFADNIRATIEIDEQDADFSASFDSLSVEPKQEDPYGFFLSSRPNLTSQPSRGLSVSVQRQPYKKSQYEPMTVPQPTYQSPRHDQMQSGTSGGTGGVPGVMSPTHPYNRSAPPLPPKQPSFSEPVTLKASANAPAKPRNGSGLIYDEPSTYQPDMYNFFSKH